MKKFKVVLIGAGGRGYSFAKTMKEHGGFQLVAVADPIKGRRDEIKNEHNLPDDMCFESWEEALALPKFADIAVIATMDKLHYEPAMKAIELGYDLLLEKPVAPTAKECADIANAAKAKGTKILVCHVLRYSPLFRHMKEMIDDGIIGDVVSIHHDECVWFEHYSHSYVRGNWRSMEDSAFMLLAKSCHDIDLMQWMIESPVKYAQSFGSLRYFVPENAPEDAPEYCIEDCPHLNECPYNALRIYSKDNPLQWRRHAFRGKYTTEEEIEEALRTTTYGKCIFKCGNDMVDRQVVNLEFENGAVASFNMTGPNGGGRHMRVMGTKGELYGTPGDDTIQHYDYLTQERIEIHPSEIFRAETIDGGHGGGDQGIVTSFYEYLTDTYKGPSLSEIDISIDNHLAVFAAEQSRLENKVVDVEEFRNDYLK